MKTHAIIPIFIPHLGCPNDCVFCNQKKITARAEPITGADMEKRGEEYLKTIGGRGIETVEIAFFGGSFTGIPPEQQREYLSVAKAYKERG
jgi:histone acetyltransferase (RNA polymerase elongator complex component)